MKIQIYLDKQYNNLSQYCGIHFGERYPLKTLYIKYSEFEFNSCEIVKDIKTKYMPILRRLKLKGYFS